MGSKASECFMFCHTQLFQIEGYTPEAHFQPFSLRHAGLKPQHCWQVCVHKAPWQVLCPSARLSWVSEGRDCPVPAAVALRMLFLSPVPDPISSPWGLPGTWLYHQITSRLGLWQCFHLDVGNGAISDFSISWSWPTLTTFCSGLKWDYGKQTYLWLTNAALCLTATKQVSLQKKYCRIRSSVSKAKYFV